MRQVFTAAGLNPNMSPLIHVPYVLLFGELIPMFVARLFPEHTAKFGSPILRITSLIITPFAYVCESLFQFLLRPWMKNDEEHHTSHVRHEELQELLRSSAHQKKEEENPSSLLFQTLQKLKEKKTSSYIRDLNSLPKIYEKRDTAFALEKMRGMKKELAIIHNKQQKIIGYITEEELLFHAPTTLLHAIAKNAIFVSEVAKASDTLSRMRQETAPFAFVVDKQGDITGIVSLYTLLEEFIPLLPSITKAASLHISKTIPADMQISEFCKKYDISLSHNFEETFLDVMERTLDHKPKVGEKLFLGPLEITVKETTLLGPKTLFVQSK